MIWSYSPSHFILSHPNIGNTLSPPSSSIPAFSIYSSDSHTSIPCRSTPTQSIQHQSISYSQNGCYGYFTAKLKIVCVRPKEWSLASADSIDPTAITTPPPSHSTISSLCVSFWRWEYRYASMDCGCRVWVQSWTLFILLYENISNKVSTLVHIQVPLSPTLLIIRLFILLAICHEGVLVKFSTHLRCFLLGNIDWLGRWLVFRLLIVLIIFFVLIIIEIVKIAILIELTLHILIPLLLFLDLCE